ncbi:DNA-binding protein [Geobacter sp.]|uniref:DNA-binding protein n=1 Tax=Geobacter sp. TaxID=46610 RepID=UPI00260681F7|nr:DNA-binding protein [Geobacter sp.]
MSRDGFSPIITLAVVLNCLLIGTAFAGFGFGGDDPGKSGLDFNKGYDVNTVTTVSGRVASSPRIDENEHVFVEVKTDGEIVSLSLGPKSFWEKQQIPLHPNDDVTVKGSKAQGRDGKIYLMVQNLTNRTTGAHAVIRNERGRTGWSWGRGSGMMPHGPGGGMMRGGGGGMMRH